MKIDVKLATVGADACASLLTELAASWTTARAAAFKLPAVTGVTPEPASVRAIVATAGSARPRRRRRVRVFVRSIAVAFRDGQSWCGASLTRQLCNPPVASRLHLRVHLLRKPWVGSVCPAVLVGGDEPLLVLFGENPGSSDQAFGRKFGLTGHEDAAFGDDHGGVGPEEPDALWFVEDS